MSSSSRICIVTGTQLCRNPRVLKEARALAGAGFEVTTVSQVLRNDLEAMDQKILRTAPWTRVVANDLLAGGGWRVSCDRLTSRAAREATRWLGLESHHAIARGLRRTLQCARHERADLYIVHQETGLWVGRQLLRSGECVAADFEDWYSRDLPLSSRKWRPLRLLRGLEQQLLKEAAYCSTTSIAMSEALAEHGNASPPIVIYNSFDPSFGEGRGNSDSESVPLRLYWISQVAAPGRGLECLFDALAVAPEPIMITIRADASEAYTQSLLGRLPSASCHQVRFLPQIDGDEIGGDAAGHDVGLALEDRDPENKDLTASNKMFHYLSAGIACIASDTKGQREVADQAPGAVRLYESGDAGSLAAAISSLAGDAAGLEAAKAAARAAAAGHLSWKAQEEKLLDSVDRALGTALKRKKSVA